MRKLIYVARQFGLDPIKFVYALKALPLFLRNYLRFLSSDNPHTVIRLSPALHDFHESAGSSDGHYFWQDLISAQWVSKIKPRNILDVGSRIDGYVAHIAAFREIDLLDIREVPQVIPNMKFIQGDAMEQLSSFSRNYQIVSSLHAIEHFGLGRYKDPINPYGHIKGLQNISDCVSANGYLIVSFPIGKEKIEFNSQRILDPLFPLKYLQNFQLEEFYLIPWKGMPIKMEQIPNTLEVPVRSAGLYLLKRID